jgi:hypothetical protein
MKVGDLVYEKWQKTVWPEEFGVGIIFCFPDLYLADVLWEEGEMDCLHTSELEVVSDGK